MTPEEKKAAFEKSKQDKIDAKLIRKVESLLDGFFKGSDAASPNVQLALMHILMGALEDANFHKEYKQIPAIFPRAKEAKFYGNSEWENNLQNKGVTVSKTAKWDGYIILTAIGWWIGKFVDKKQGAAVARMGRALQNESVNIYMANYAKSFINEVSRNNIHEGMMSELDLMAKEASSFEDFKKEVFNINQYKKHKGNKEVESFLEKFYKDAVNESVMNEVKYRDVTDMKSSLLKNSEFSNLLNGKEYKFIIRPDVKVFKGLGMAYTFTDGKSAIMAVLNKPVKILKPLGRASNFMKAAYQQNESVMNEASEPDVITQLRDIVKTKQNKKIKDPKTGKKMTVDLYSASAIVGVYDAVKRPDLKEKYANAGLVAMTNFAFKALGKRESVNEAYVVMYAKKKGEKPASAAYRDKAMALKFEKDLKKDGYITMVTQKPVKGVDESRISEARADDYYDSATEAVNAAKADIEKRGFEVDENDWQDQIATGGKYGRLRPGNGKTHKFTVGLIKNGKPQRKALQISLYGMPSGKYELTYYVN